MGCRKSLSAWSKPPSALKSAFSQLSHGHLSLLSEAAKAFGTWLQSHPWWKLQDWYPLRKNDLKADLQRWVTSENLRVRFRYLTPRFLSALGFQSLSGSQRSESSFLGKHRISTLCSHLTGPSLKTGWIQLHFYLPSATLKHSSNCLKSFSAYLSLRRLVVCISSPMIRGRRGQQLNAAWPNSLELCLSRSRILCRQKVANWMTCLSLTFLKGGFCIFQQSPRQTWRSFKNGGHFTFSY